MMPAIICTTSAQCVKQGVRNSLRKAAYPHGMFFYEDFIQDYEQTVHKILSLLELGPRSVVIAPPALTKLTGFVSEEWVQGFREECQQGWKNRGW